MMRVLMIFFNETWLDVGCIFISLACFLLLFVLICILFVWNGSLVFFLTWVSQYFVISSSRFYPCFCGNSIFIPFFLLFICFCRRPVFPVKDSQAFDTWDFQTKRLLKIEHWMQPKGWNDLLVFERCCSSLEGPFMNGVDFYNLIFN